MFRVGTERQCVETIQEGPKLKYYQIGGAETTLIIVAIRRDNYLQDFNMVKIESRPQTNDYQQCRKRTAFGSESYSGTLITGSEGSSPPGVTKFKVRL